MGFGRYGLLSLTVSDSPRVSDMPAIVLIGAAAGMLGAVYNAIWESVCKARKARAKRAATPRDKARWELLEVRPNREETAVSSGVRSHPSGPGERGVASWRVRAVPPSPPARDRHTASRSLSLARARPTLRAESERRRRRGPRGAFPLATRRAGAGAALGRARFVLSASGWSRSRRC